MQYAKLAELLEQTGVVLSETAKPKAGIYSVKVFSYNWPDGPAETTQISIPEFTEGRVVRHSVMLRNAADAEKILEYQSTDNWAHWEERLDRAQDWLGIQPENMKRSRKRQTIESFLIDCGSSAVAAEQFASVIRSEMQGAVTHTITRQIRNAYEGYYDWSWSCMTGSRAANVDVYETNQEIHAAIFYRNGMKIGRTLIVREQSGPWSLPECGEPNFSEGGWYYLRVYGNRSRSCEPEMVDDIRACCQHLESLGIKSADGMHGHVSLEVPDNQRMPWIDGPFSVWYANVDAGSKAVLAQSRPSFARSWTKLECSSDGTDLTEAPSECCENCGESYDAADEEAGHVVGWGCCCPSCYQEGVYCEHIGETVAPDRAIELVSRDNSIDQQYIHDIGQNRLSVNAGHWVNGVWRPRVVDIHRATNSADETVFAPVDECVVTVNDEWIWRASVEELHEDFVEVSGSFTMNPDTKKLEYDGLREQQYEERAYVVPLLDEDNEEFDKVSIREIVGVTKPAVVGEAAVRRRGCEYDMVYKVDNQWVKLDVVFYSIGEYIFHHANKAILSRGFYPNPHGKSISGWVRRVWHQTFMRPTVYGGAYGIVTTCGPIADESVNNMWSATGVHTEMPMNLVEVQLKAENAGIAEFVRDDAVVARIRGNPVKTIFTMPEFEFYITNNIDPDIVIAERFTRAAWLVTEDYRLNSHSPVWDRLCSEFTRLTREWRGEGYMNPVEIFNEAYNNAKVVSLV